MTDQMHDGTELDNDWRDDLAVFPVDGKTPMVPWRAQSATWEEWTGRWPKGAGFGIDCGKSGLVVLDEDSLGAVSAWLGYVPLTYTVRTGKGRHFYFLAPAGVVIRNSAGKVAPGVDVRAEGGYVVGAGSLHPSGVKYAVENGGSPAPLPGDVLARLTTTERQVRDVIPQGQRDDHLFHFACSLRAKALPDEQALPLLRAEWARCDPPYTERTPEAMWAHVVAQYPAGRVLLEVDGVLVEGDKFERLRQDRLLFRLADRSARDMIEDAEIASMPDLWLPGDAVLDIPPVSVIWGLPAAPLTAHGQQTLIVGPDGTGKSTINQHYSKARMGLPGWAGEMLGEPVEVLADDARVLYLAVDRPIQILEGFQRGLDRDDADLRALLHDRLVFWPGPPPAELWEKAGRLWLLRFIEEKNIRLVVIDSRKDVGNEMDQTEVSGFNRTAKYLDADGVELVMPHHNVQNADPPNVKPELTHVFGLRPVYSGAGSVLMIKGKPSAEIVHLWQVKAIREAHAPMRVRIDHQKGRVELAPLVVPAPDGTLTIDTGGQEGSPAVERLVAIHAELLRRGTTGRTEFIGRSREGTERRALVATLTAADLVREEKQGAVGYLSAVDLSEATVRARLGHSP